MSNAAYEHLQAVAQGGEPAGPFQIAWGVHEGMRGTKWFMVGSDGAVLVNHIKPVRGPAAPQRPTEIGRLAPDDVLTLCSILCAMRFDLLKPPPMDPSDVGQAEVELAISLPNERFSLRCPSSKLADLYGLDEIGRVMNELRKKFPTE